MRTHEDISELLGAYALDAVDEPERRLVEAHLATCDPCRTEVAEHRAAIAGIVEDDAQPPSRVWDRMERAIAEPRTIPTPRTWRRRATAALGAAALIATAFLGWRVAVLDARLERVAGDGLVATAARALANPDAQRLVLRSPGGETAVDAVVLPDGAGYLVQDNLAPLPHDRTYQLWAMVGEQPISAGVIGADPGVTPFRVGTGTTALAITVERAAGAAQPTSAPIADASLTLA